MQLVIDTATEACSVALLDGERVLAHRFEVIGRGHAERLLPMIAELPKGGRAEAILVDCGPGSFTGVRVGLAAARALGLAWGIPVNGYGSLPLVATAALARRPQFDRVAVAMLAGHGEVFVQRFSTAPFAERTMLASLTPERAVEAIDEPLIAGNAAADLVAIGASAEALQMLPEAADTALLPLAFRKLEPKPIYGRAPDAKPMA